VDFATEKNLPIGRFRRRFIICFGGDSISPRRSLYNRSVELEGTPFSFCGGGVFFFLCDKTPIYYCCFVLVASLVNFKTVLLFPLSIDHLVSRLSLDSTLVLELLFGPFLGGFLCLLFVISLLEVFSFPVLIRLIELYLPLDSLGISDLFSSWVHHCNHLGCRIVGYVLYSLHVCVCGCIRYDNCVWRSLFAIFSGFVN